MQKIKDKFRFDLKFFLFIAFFYSTIFFGFFLNEDNLGGAKWDFDYHFNISKQFSINFLDTFYKFGNEEYSGMATRNSPVFWAFLSIFIDHFSYDQIRLLNTFVILLSTLTFYKCLKIKFNEEKNIYIALLSTLLIISPSFRSLAIWPYSLSWGLYFFILSIYFYLKYESSLNFLRSFLILLFTVIAAYIYPSFSVFFLYFLFKIIENFKNKKIIFLLILIFLFFLIPAIYYVFAKDALSAFQNAQGLDKKINLTESFNIANKILIISTIFFYLILPFLNFNRLLKDFKRNSLIQLLSIFFLWAISVYYFNFPHSVFGGGFFHKLSNIFFGNNYLFFFSSLISLIIIFSLVKKNFNNLFIFILLLFYNPQLTIYIKYFDPLVIILFLFLIEKNLNFKKYFFEKKYKYIQLYGTYIFYYIVIYLKNYF